MRFSSQKVPLSASEIGLSAIETGAGEEVLDIGVAQIEDNFIEEEVLDIGIVAQNEDDACPAVAIWKVNNMWCQ